MRPPGVMAQMPHPVDAGGILGTIGVAGHLWAPDVPAIPISRLIMGAGEGGFRAVWLGVIVLGLVSAVLVTATPAQSRQDSALPRMTGWRDIVPHGASLPGAAKPLSTGGPNRSYRPECLLRKEDRRHPAHPGATARSDLPADVSGRPANLPCVA